MLTEKDYRDLGWEDLCSNNCYSAYDHSHNFTLGKDLKKICADCKQEVKAEAQVYATNRENTAKLYSIYNCVCGNKAVATLYSGVPKAYIDIYATALLNADALMLLLV